MQYPIGIQSFEDLRTRGCIYVDKTALVYKLISEYKYVFLGRPRRFGKSLLLSTIQAYFEGRRDLFEGLAIEQLADDWARHPVLHFDLNFVQKGGVVHLMNALDVQLADYEAIYGRSPKASEPQLRLRWLIREAYRQTGRKVVILVDEYDKPVLNSLQDPELSNAMRDALKPFYSLLKSEDAYIRFAMLTGVSKFGKLSIFSDLNNIEDISLSNHFAAICGLTEEELLKTFDTEIEEFADEREVSKEQMVQLLRKKYDGYRFSTAKTLVYNPFSLLLALKKQELSDYWFETATPSFLVRLIEEEDFDLSNLDGVVADAASLYKINNFTAIPALYQTGYLTIKDFDIEAGVYTLGYPNQEVEAAFLKYLLPYYSNLSPNNTNIELFKLIKEIKAGDVDAFMGRLKSIFYCIPYAKDNSAKVQEDQFRNLTYLIFKLVGMQIHVECPMSKGRSDAVVWTKGHIYVLEFKIDSTPEKALEQIREKAYAEPHRADGRKVVCIGVNYSTAERCITGWAVENK